MKTVLRPLGFVSIGVVAGFAIAGVSAVNYEPLEAAPDYHRPVLENDRVRVLDVRIAPGDTVPAHQHGLPSVFITLQSSDLVFRDLEGETVRKVSRSEHETMPHVEWREPAPAPRQVSNVGPVELRAIRIELKDPTP
jgi:hypothetical protein